MIKVGIIIVTYNRKSELMNNLRCLERLTLKEGYQYYKYVIDNNSTDGTEEIIDKSVVKYIRLKSNYGGAGGFYYGMKRCIEDGMDCIWGMDDDAYPHKDSLCNLLTEFEKESSCCYWSNCNGDLNFPSNGRKSTSTWMFVGFFIDAKKVYEIGYPRKDFFIYHDDAEYARRIQSHGYNIIKVKDSVISHKDGFEKGLEIKKIGKRVLHYHRVPNWKCYYQIRNELLMYKMTEWEFWKILYKDLKYIVTLLIFNIKQIPISLLAIFHGIIRISGIKILP